MTDDDDRRMLQGIIAHCSDKLEEAARAPAGRSPADDRQAARERAYARVMRAARELLDEMEG